MGRNLKDLVGFRKITTGPLVGRGLEFTFRKRRRQLVLDNLAAGRKRFQRLTDDRTGRVDTVTVALTRAEVYKAGGLPRTRPTIMANLRAKLHPEDVVMDEFDEDPTGDIDNPDPEDSSTRPWPRFRLNVRDTGRPFDAEFVMGREPADGQWPEQQPEID